MATALRLFGQSKLRRSRCVNDRGVIDGQGGVFLLHQHPDFRAPKNHGFSAPGFEFLNDAGEFTAGFLFVNADSEFIKDNRIDEPDIVAFRD